MTGMKRPVHPGKILADELGQRGIGSGDLAGQRSIADIIACKSPITREIAALLEKRLGIESLFWINLQTQYDQAMSAFVVNETTTK